MGPILRYVGRKPRVWLLLLGYVLHLATLRGAEKAISAAFGIPTRGVIILDAGFGMDMDLPEDLEMVSETLEHFFNDDDLVKVEKG